jgi:ribosomal protein L11 methylase PrmA
LNNNTAIRDSASFRDPSGAVYILGKRIIRAVNASGVRDFRVAYESGLLDELVDMGSLLGFRELARDESINIPGAEMLLEHPKVPVISYSYEWTFETLKIAAIAHLDIQIYALKKGFVLKDATPFNIQFVRCAPVLIDHLSIRPYTEGEMWLAQRQFVEEFLTPLLMWSLAGVSHNEYCMGNAGRIRYNELSSIISPRRKLSVRLFKYLILPNILQQNPIANELYEQGGVRNLSLPRSAYLKNLEELKEWIASMSRRSNRLTSWTNYEYDKSYRALDAAQKAAFIAEFCGAVQPERLIDLGCNAGEYAKVSLESGAQLVIGCDNDHGALERAFLLGRNHTLQFLPLYVNVENPTPSIGWRNIERGSLIERATPDAALALALAHHLVISRGIPLEAVVEWVVDTAKEGVIEFVSLNDPVARNMARMAGYSSTSYNEAAFVDAVLRKAKIRKVQRIMEGQRMLVWYERE